MSFFYDILLVQILGQKIVYTKTVEDRKGVCKMTHEIRIIAVDFDGTLCSDRYPEIGKPNQGLIHYLKDRKKHGSKLILWTCRCSKPLENAVDWCISQGLEFDAINENVPEIIERFGSNSRKIYADLYFDDKAYREVCRHDQMEEQIDNKIS